MHLASNVKLHGGSMSVPHLPVVGVLSADVGVVVAVGAGQQPEHLVILGVRGVEPGGLVPGITYHLRKFYDIMLTDDADKTYLCHKTQM